MVAKPETLGRFIFNSDYPVDKIVWLYEGQKMSPADASMSEYIKIDVPSMTGSKQPIFVKGSYSLDNWQTSSMIGVDVDNADASKQVSLNMIWTNYDGSGIEITFSARTSAAESKLVKYRLWGVCREDRRDAVDFAKNSSVVKNKLVFDTDKNYPRLVKDGVAKSGDVIEHNLGKIPYVDFWYNYSGNFNTSWFYLPTGELIPDHVGLPYAPTVRATDKTITFTKQLSGGSPIDVYYYYRVYA